MNYSDTKLAALAQEVQDVFSERDALQAQANDLSSQVSALQTQVDSNNSNIQAMQSGFDQQLSQAGNMLNAEKDARTADQQSAAAALASLQALFDQYQADHP